MLSRAVRLYAHTTRVTYLAPGEPEATVKEEFPPFDETVAMLRLTDELDELDYDDLELVAS